MHHSTFSHHTAYSHGLHRVGYSYHSSLHSRSRVVRLRHHGATRLVVPQVYVSSVEDEALGEAWDEYARTFDVPALPRVAQRVAPYCSFLALPLTAAAMGATWWATAVPFDRSSSDRSQVGVLVSATGVTECSLYGSGAFSSSRWSTCESLGNAEPFADSPYSLPGAESAGLIFVVLAGVGVLANTLVLLVSGWCRDNC